MRYGIASGGWVSLMSCESHVMSLWKFILAQWVSFSQFVAFELWDGTSICFWNDVWYDTSPQKLNYLELFRIACSPDVFMADVHCLQGTTMQWEMFSRAAQN